ncbi:hypothetical protein [Sphingomonas sp. LaA6.9]|uniref:hypothetical protein n=1 Tax=Sphingomonas sp. LaA6.9 TaxID=2919914 RepID=UPI001F5015C3|nr:hypothetical protein [Sphingomonas sp. LaA6.9]MCJ8158820.1 hypothetical protein [Sphingomonas sp. LaA6.9]
MNGPNFNFDLMTPDAPHPLDASMQLRLSIRPPWSIEMAEIQRAVDEELANRRAAYPGFVRRRSMSQEEADRHLQLLEACAEDLRGNHRFDGPSWHEKVAELRREIMLRRRLYPKRIADRRLAEDLARRQIEGLEAAHWQFWINLVGWTRLGAGETLSERLQPVREQALQVDLWERAARAADNPAARPLSKFITPPDWKEAA